MNRKQQIKEIVDHILKLNLTHPTRVGVSGITASGKTTFANEVAEEIHNQKYMYSLLLIVIILV
ncbi:uridine kinase [Bacillus cereus]|uniref:uridine kinase n=1 Tax=Bacillus TaxID=1386 RepID=UPI000BF3F6D9|nr:MULTISPECIES: uridine kinase [Bacillus cereus group]PFN35676.1 uridine kinase [Bacillus cereus]MCU5208808.1 uridine kinase [Bacillus paranthracis]MDA2141962.1 uridine kinase [Bacillus cereus group sp. Bc248]MDA2160387.1 uridine kinase [Bacillus cereus group sp. Bc252]MDA2170709.1 uridine kinase [Bacillus cereus group sp. Bc247]